MSKHANGWMMLGVCLTLTLPLSGCVNAVSGDAICSGTESARTEHAAALADDGGPLSLVTGARLIQLIDAGCDANL
jgi:hypothetical protein